jgi:hypothetical protein
MMPQPLASHHTILSLLRPFLSISQGYVFIPSLEILFYCLLLNKEYKNKYKKEDRKALS